MKIAEQKRREFISWKKLLVDKAYCSQMSDDIFHEIRYDVINKRNTQHTYPVFDWCPALEPAKEKSASQEKQREENYNS